MTEERHNEIVALGKDPIAPDRPVGDPVRYEEIFTQLQGQMDRIGSLTGEQVEWAEVVRLASEILKSKSKDLLVMTYLTIALFETNGYGGLAAAFECYREFVKTFWDACFPKVKPPHGRFNAVQYMVEKILPLVEEKGGQVKKAPGGGEKEAVHKCADLVAELDAAIVAAFQKSAAPESPNLAPFVRAFKALKQKVGPLVAEAPPAPAPGAPTGAAAPSGAPAAAAPAGVAAVPESFASATQATQVVIKVAKYLISTDNKDVRGYRLMRAVQFGAITQPPKDRLIPGPPPQRKQFFENLVGSANWPQLLTEAEGQFAVTPMWLDLQRYVAQAAANHGPMYEAVHDAVAFETVALRNRMPELFDLCFKEGTPFADGATKSWLDEAGKKFGGGGGGGAGGGDKDPLSAAIAEARKLLAAAKQPEAVARLSSQADGSASRRDRFRAQLALAGFFADMNKHALAGSLLEGLEREIDAYKLEDWEPNLAAQALREFYSWFKKAKPKPTPDETKRGNDVLARLCRVDPSAAFKLDDGK
ncbi:MAG: type VI secretion system protein TssA [Phycisphaerae bacterium]|jgi:type VI secretion system protein VasJ